MKNILIISILLFTVCGCSQPQIQLTDQQIRGGVTKEAILSDIQQIKVGMNINDAIGYIMRNASTGPFWKDMGSGKVKYYFAVGENKQITIDIENPEKLLPKSPIMPNGVVVKVGKLKNKESWILKWSDSNELK